MAHFTVANQALRGSLFATRMFHALQCTSNDNFSIRKQQGLRDQIMCSFLVGY